MSVDFFFSNQNTHFVKMNQKIRIKEQGTFTAILDFLQLRTFKAILHQDSYKCISREMQNWGKMQAVSTKKAVAILYGLVMKLPT